MSPSLVVNVSSTLGLGEAQKLIVMIGCQRRFQFARESFKKTMAAKGGAAVG